MEKITVVMMIHPATANGVDEDNDETVMVEHL